VADSLRVERVLAQTRAHYRAAPIARERVRATLQARGEWGRGPSAQPAQHAGRSPSLLAAAHAAGVAKSTALVLAGLSFVAGFWLGDWHATERAAQTSGVVTATPSASSQTPALAQLPSAAHADPSLTAPPAAPALPIEQAAQPRTTAREAGSTPASVPATTRASNAAPLARAPRHVARATHPSTEMENMLSSELVLLQRAERAIRSGEPDLALSFLDDLDRRFPDTRLIEERAAARLMARCARREPDAAEQAQLFLRDRRRSVYSDRLSALCQIHSSPEAPDGSGNAGH
jgi:hypothetical protein